MGGVSRPMEVKAEEAVSSPKSGDHVAAPPDVAAALRSALDIAEERVRALTRAVRRMLPMQRLVFASSRRGP